MNESRYDWRCMCGAENRPTHIDCAECGKQRWSQLGIKRENACALKDAIIPRWLAVRVA